MKKALRKIVIGGTGAVVAGLIASYLFTGGDGCQLRGHPDKDGDGYSDPTTQVFRYPWEPRVEASDCDDNDRFSHPGAAEVCDARDNDCDGDIDNGVSVLLYEDADGDGYGSTVSKRFCTTQDGWAEKSGDCDDNDASINPGAAEVCDDKDNNCNGSVDELGGLEQWRDQDGDGFGGIAIEGCDPVKGAVQRGGDCDDSLDHVFPGAGFSDKPRGDGSYDVNCDGKVEKEEERIGKCNGGTADKGWYSAVPACGAKGSFLTDCDRKLLKGKIQPETDEKVQRCR